MPQPSWPMNGSVMWAVCEPERAVAEELDRPDPEDVVALARPAALGDRELEVGVAGALRDAQPQGPVGVHLGVGRPGVLAVDVGDARQADREQPAPGQRSSHGRSGDSVVRDDVEQLLGRLAQDAGRLAVGVAHDLAADRVGGVARDAGALQRKGVRPDRVAVDARQRCDAVAARRSRARGGRAAPGTAQRLWFHRPLCSHSPSGRPSAWARTSSSVSSSERASRRSTDDRSRESHSVWMWASCSPGMTTAPGRSTTSSAPALADAASADPTATTRPSSTSSAVGPRVLGVAGPDAVVPEEGAAHAPGTRMSLPVVRRPSRAS